MSPSTDDLRALLAQRAARPGAPAPFDEGIGARLAGVRVRVGRRRRARRGAAALAAALVAGSATVVTADLRDRAAPAPAERPAFPGRDLAGRGLATVLAATADDPGATVTLEQGRSLHLAARCEGPASVTAVVVVNGAGVGRLACGGEAAGDLYLDPEGPSDVGLDPGSTVTVGLHLAVTPAPGALPVVARGAPLQRAEASLAVYSASPRLATPLPPDTVTSPDAGAVLLGGAGSPVTEDFGTRSFRVVSAETSVAALATRCTTSPGGPAYATDVVVDGARVPGTECTLDAGSGYSGGGMPLTLGTRSPRPVPGRPVPVSLQLLQRDEFDAPRLERTLPGASAAIAVYGAPYLPAALQEPTLLSPPEVDAQGRPLVLALVSSPDRAASATVRLTGPDTRWVVTCGRAGVSPPVLVAGLTGPTCGSPTRPRELQLAGRWQGAPVDVAVDIGVGTADGGTTVLAVYGPAEVRRAVQPQPRGLPHDPTAHPETPSFEPYRDSGRGSMEGTVAVRLTTRPGQPLPMTVTTGRVLALQVTCRGTSRPVAAVVVLDGRPRVANLSGAEPCGSGGGQATIMGRPGEPHRVELRVTGPDAALVSAVIYGVQPGGAG